MQFLAFLNCVKILIIERGYIDMKNVKTIAIFLPQFHEVPENNMWWGKGFTEWQAVRTAEPLFEGHYQPKKPYDNFYYDLLDKNTMIKHQKMMNQYGIYGLSFYHYYFKDGKKILEKPAENLLKWKDINIPFCFNWASESWIRTWSKIMGNVWGEKYDKKVKEEGSGILLEQNYGVEKDWIEHFNYMLPFFKDMRYIKKDNKPLFIFYNSNQITCLDEMIKCWRDLAVQNGFDGLYILGAHVTMGLNQMDGILEYQPDEGIVYANDNNKAKIINGVRCYEYSDIVQQIVESKPKLGKKTYFMGLTGYDTTPRRGINGECILNNNVETFEYMMDKLYEKSIQFNNEYVFIDAWNEWGEGMYLEPDAFNGYKFLEAHKLVVEKYKDKMVDDKTEIANTIFYKDEQIKILDNTVQKYKSFFDDAIGILSIIQAKKAAFWDYFQKNEIDSVAIYGMGQLGRILICEFKKENIKVMYTVDRGVGQFSNEIKMFRPEEILPKVDMLIVTAYDYKNILEKLNLNNIKKVISLKELISIIKLQDK